MKNVFRIFLFLNCFFASHVGFGYTLNIINNTLWTWHLDIKAESGGWLTFEGGVVEDSRTRTINMLPYSKGTISNVDASGISKNCWTRAIGQNRYKTKINLMTGTAAKVLCGDIYVSIRPKDSQDQFTVVHDKKDYWESYWNDSKGDMADNKKHLDAGDIWYRGRWVKPG